MAEKRKAQIVDGYAALRAAREKEEQTGSTVVPKKSERASGPVKKTITPASRIGRTVVPRKHELVCYACDFSFEITVRNQNTVCPKCRERLVVQDEKITEEWEGELCTMGKVVIGPEAVIKSGNITANTIVLEGKLEPEVSLRATCRFEIAEGAVFDLKQVKARDLLIDEGVRYTLPKKNAFKLKNVEVKGELKAKLELAGTLKIYKTGSFIGDVKSSGLWLEDGGGLSGKCAIVPVQKMVNKPNAKPLKVKQPQLKKSA